MSRVISCHEYQKEHAAHLPTRIVNIACKEDPAGLGKAVDAVNVDLLEYDPHTNTDLRKLPNFQAGDALALPFKDGEFGGAVLGEFIEHCRPEIAYKALMEAKRVTRKGRQIILTFPIDPRPPEVQHPKHLLIEWDEGITSWHQTVWDDEKLDRLLEATRLKPIHRAHLSYIGIRWEGRDLVGVGLCLVDVPGEELA